MTKKYAAKKTPKAQAKNAQWFEPNRRHLSSKGIKEFKRLIKAGYNDCEIGRAMNITASGARFRRVNIGV